MKRSNRRSRSARDEKYSRSLVVKPRSNIERDLFLEMGLPLTDELDVQIDTSPGRIELELRGAYDQVDTLLNKLRKLEQQINNALYPDKNGYYQYSAEILTQLCKPPVNLDLFAAATSVFKFDSKHDANGQLQSQAPLEDLTSIHQNIVKIREMILGEFNRDIERFFVIIALTINTEEIDLIIDTAIDLEIIKETEYGFQFAVSEEEAKNQLLDKLGIDLGDAMVVPEERELNDIDIGDLGFDGGKIVFLKDGKEVEPDDL